jgi:hypothetical protein
LPNITQKHNTNLYYYFTPELLQYNQRTKPLLQHHKSAMAAALNEHEKKLAQMKEKIDAMEADLELLVSEYD